MELQLSACRYATPAAGDRDARDVKEMCPFLIKQLIFGKGKDRDPNIIGDDRYSLFPYDHRPELDARTMDYRESMVRNILSGPYYLDVVRAVPV